MTVFIVFKDVYIDCETNTRDMLAIFESEDAAKVFVDALNAKFKDQIETFGATHDCLDFYYETFEVGQITDLGKRVYFEGNYMASD